MPIRITAASQTFNEAAVRRFNASTPVGAAVRYRNDRGEIIETHTRSEASVLGGHTPVVWLEKVRGCVALDRVSKQNAEAC